MTNYSTASGELPPRCTFIYGPQIVPEMSDPNWRLQNYTGGI